MTSQSDTCLTPATKPAVLSLLSDIDTPVAVFEKLSHNSAAAFLFESAEPGSRLSRFSFIGVDPLKLISLTGGQATVHDTLTGTSQTDRYDNPLNYLRSILESASNHIHPEALPDFLPFTGGLVGYLGYGATKQFENIPKQETDPLSIPDAYYALYDSVLVYDHFKRNIYIISHRGSEHAQTLKNRLFAQGSLSPLNYPSEDLPDEAIFQSVSGPFTRSSFIATVNRAKEYICEGQVFQIVVAQRFATAVHSKPLDLYRVLQSINPSPYAYFMKFPGFSYLGSSPETFVSCQAGHVVLRALAGTRRRGDTDEEDECLAAELRADEKELAEHHMLVDLGRNDLGRICQVGTITVGEIGTITRYSHVMHLATELSGELRADKNCFDVIRACFPRGTVSGAPKIRAMQLLTKLEPEQRGVYSGCVGYFDFRGNTDSAIAIRSALVKDGVAHVHAGAGIVYDSDPASEYEETRNKAKSVLKSIAMAERMSTDDSTNNR